MDAAAALARQYRYRFRIVTLDGQVIHPGGSPTGGSLVKNAGLISRTAEIEQLKQNLETRRDQERETMEQLNRRRRKRFRRLRKRSRFGRRLQKLRNIGWNKTVSGAECAPIGKPYSISGENWNRNIAGSLPGRFGGCQTAGSSPTGNFRRTNFSSAAGIGKVKRKPGGKQSTGRAALPFASGNSVGLFIRRKRPGNFISHFGRIGASAADSQSASLYGTAGKSAVEQNNQVLEGHIKTNQETARRLRREAQEAKEAGAAIQARRMELEHGSVALRNQEREQSNTKEMVSRELARLEERKAGLQKEYDEIISRLWEEYELTRREAEDGSSSVEEPAKAQRRLNELKNQIRALGAVNVAAVEEYREVSERHAFLTNQLADVEKSRDELRGLIRELTSQMQDQFLEQFQQINQNFKQTFAQLFGGGSAYLELENPEDILACGIQIAVQDRPVRLFLPI